MYSLLNKIIPTVIISILLLLGSCGQTTKPEGILEEDKLSEILADVHMAEASLQLFQASQRDSIARGYYGHIFRIHDVEEAEFYDSMEHYSANAKAMADIYEQAGEILANMDKGTKDPKEKKEK